MSELERKTLLEGMFRDVASIVVEKSYNTETGRAYSMSMIQNAMKDVHFSVNLSKGAKQQALDVIRRLKKVMPIARTKLALRISTPSVHADELQAMLVANAADIVKRSMSSLAAATTPAVADDIAVREDISVTVIETNINPENFRVIEDLTTSLTKGKGILEIIHQQQALAPNVGVSHGEDEDGGAGGQVKLFGLKCAEDSDLRESKNHKQGRSSKSNSNSSSIKDDAKEEEVVFFMAKSGQRSGDKKKKKDKKKQRNQEQQREEELLEQDEGEEAAAALRTLALLEEKVKARQGGGVGDGPVPKDSKKSKKNKRLEKERQKQFDSQEQERSERLLALETERLEGTVLSADGVTISVPAITTGSLNDAPFKCNTCCAPFADSLAHRAHFKSDWHRINLKRKLLKLPLVTSEEEFYSVHVDHWDCSIDA